MTPSHTITNALDALEALPDDTLLAKLTTMVTQEYAATARLVAHLAEVDARRLPAAEGYGSLYHFCLHALHLSEHAAYGRCKAARVARRFPRVLEELAAGRLTLTAIVLLAPQLTGPNHVELLEMARGRTRRDLEELLAARQPAPPADDLVRRLPAGGSAGTAPVPTQRQVAPWDAALFDSAEASSRAAGIAPPEGARPDPMEPGGEPQQQEAAVTPVAGTGAAGENAAELSAPTAQTPPPRPSSVPGAPGERVSPLDAAVYRVQFTARADTYRRLIQVRELMRHQVPDGDLATIFDRALGLLYQALARRKFALVMGEKEGPADPAGAGTSAPFRLVPREERRRHIPAAVRRAVWRRDGGRCAFTSAGGRRCAERERLEFHHRVPFARGGPATPDNIELRCRAHNLYEEPEPTRGRPDR